MIFAPILLSAVLLASPVFSIPAATSAGEVKADGLVANHVASFSMNRPAMAFVETFPSTPDKHGIQDSSHKAPRFVHQ